MRVNYPESASGTEINSTLTFREAPAIFEQRAEHSSNVSSVAQLVKDRMSKGRFNNLEFGSQKEESVEPSQTTSINQVRDLEYYMNAALKAEFQDDLDAALRSYAAALGENPKHLDAWTGQVWILCELDELSEAELWAGKGMESFPDNPALLALRSLAVFRMGRENEAIELNDVALDAKGGDNEWVWLCRAEIILNHHQGVAEECFSHARRTSSKPEAVLLRIGSLCLRSGRYVKALSSLQEFNSKHPDSPRGWALLGATQKSSGFSEQARISFTNALEISPDNIKYKLAIKSNSGLKASINGFFRRITGK